MRQQGEWADRIAALTIGEGTCWDGDVAWNVVGLDNSNIDGCQHARLFALPSSSTHWSDEDIKGCGSTCPVDGEGTALSRG